MWRHVTLTFYHQKVNTSLRADNDMKLALRNMAHIVHVTSMTPWLWLVYIALHVSMFNSLKSQTAFHGLLGFVNLWYFHRVQKDQPYHSSYHFCIYDICIELYTSLGLAGIAWSHGLCVILYVRLSTYSLYWSLSIYKRIHHTCTSNKTQNANVKFKQKNDTMIKGQHL